VTLSPRMIVAQIVESFLFEYKLTEVSRSTIGNLHG